MIKTDRCHNFNALKLQATKIYMLTIILVFYSLLCCADELFIEGTDADGWDISEYREVDDTNVVDGFVKDLKGNIIFLEDESQNVVEEDAFGQVPGFEDDMDFFGQDYEINLDEE